MTKLDFILALNEKLSALPREEVRERIGFYAEMIEDRMEEGLTEEEAVAAVGSVEEIAAQIATEITPLSPQRKPKRAMKAWEIVLLVLGSPVWLSLAIAVLAVALSVYATLWSVVISLWSVFAALAGCGFGLTLFGIGCALAGKADVAMAVTGAGLICAGLSVFFFGGSLAASKGLVWLTGKGLAWLKNRFARKEEA